jgi:tetratricopeptide (TPR) repeat protein
MPKGNINDTRRPTASDRFREKIGAFEIALADLRGRREGVLDLLKLRDELEEDMATLAEEGLDLRAEKTRLETINNGIYRRAGAIVRELRAVGGLAEARRIENPPEDHWWWYVDLDVAEKQRKSAIKVTAIVVGVAVLLLTFNYVMNKFFGMDPVEREARGFANVAEKHLSYGEYDEALPLYEQAVAVHPGLADVQIMLGVLYEKDGRLDEAKKALAAGEAAIGDPADYYITLARSYQSIGETDVALEKVQMALELKPESAQAYIIRGGIYEETGKEAEAVQDYGHAASLAQEQEQSAIYVLARMREGMLMQRAPGFGSYGTGF